MKLSILVPVDVDEPRSWTGVQTMLKQVSEGNDVELTVVSIVPEMGTLLAQAAQAMPFASQNLSELSGKATHLAKERLGKILDAGGATVHHQIVRTGSVYSEILKSAAETEANLIVLLSHVPDFGDYLLGPNAAKIVRHAKCSVLVVRPE